MDLKSEGVIFLHVILLFIPTLEYLKHCCQLMKEYIIIIIVKTLALDRGLHVGLVILLFAIQ